MVVGNMGSTEMMDYTVIGDAVNLGARLEAITREYNYPIIISEFTYEFIKGQFLTEKIEAIKVKGKEKPVLIYAVLGRMP
jgi:adenylate cyclase